MRVIVFGARPDEINALDKYSKDFGMTLTLEYNNLSLNNVHLTKDFDMVSIIGRCSANEEIIKLLWSNGIKYIATRSTGYENIDLNTCKKLGIKVSNSSYSPSSVGEFAVMSTLNLLRNLPFSFRQVEKNNFSLKGLQGRELRSQTVGVIGTGRIGKAAIRAYFGFGCKILAYDPYPSPELIGLVTYVSLEELYKNSDIITLHIPYSEANHYMINQDTLSLMKNEVIIVNTSRGELINTKDLIHGLQLGTVGGVALDVIEGEDGVLHTDWSERPLQHDDLAILKLMPNVQITAHHAFYTREAVSDMVEYALSNLVSFYKTGDAPNSLIG